MVTGQGEITFHLSNMPGNIVPQMTLKAFATELCAIYNDVFPEFAVIMQLFCCSPQLSLMQKRLLETNLTKTKSRNRLGEERLDQLMRISINGPDFALFDYFEHAAVSFWAIRDWNI